MKKLISALLVVVIAIAFTSYSSRLPRIVADPYKRRKLGSSGSLQQRQEKEPFRLTLITTNDLHSAADGTGGCDSLPESKRGGYNRLQATIESIRASRQAEGSHVLTLDAGDWFSGTMFSHLGPSEKTNSIPELSFFEAAGYDAVAVGNHEFDAGVPALQRMLKKHYYNSPSANNDQGEDGNSDDQGKRVSPRQHGGVPILSSNMVSPLEGIQPFLIKDLGRNSGTENEQGKQQEVGRKAEGGPRVGIFSLMSPDAAFCCQGTREKSPVSFTGYNDTTDARQYDLLHEAANKMVKFLREDESCDIVILLMHGGTDLNDRGEMVLEEDMDLAKAVPGIDIIVAGHTHENYFRFLDRGNEYDVEGSVPPLTTYMWQCDSEGKSLGVADFTFRLDGKGGLFPDQRIAEGSKAVCLNMKLPGENKESEMAVKVRSWRKEAAHLLGLETADELIFNKSCSSSIVTSSSSPSSCDEHHQEGAEEEDCFLSASMTPLEVSTSIAAGILDQIRAELKELKNCEERKKKEGDHAGEGDQEGHSTPVSPLLGPADSIIGHGVDQDVNNDDAEQQQQQQQKREDPLVYAYVSCIECVRAEIYEEPNSGGFIPLLGSDVFRTMGVTGSKPVALFYMSKSAVKGAIDLADLLTNWVSPIYGLAISKNVKYEVGWGVPFFNRVKSLSVDGVPFEELPDRVLIATSGYIANHFWRAEEMSNGFVGSLPLSADGRRIPVKEMESTFATGLPVEYQLLIKHLQRLNS